MAESKSARKPSGPTRPALSHFLCLPLVTPESRPQLEASLAAFREKVSFDDVCGSINDDESIPDQDAVFRSIHPKAIRPVGALHCTLGVMSLDSQRLEEATSFLSNLNISEVIRTAFDIESAREIASPDQSFRIDLKGLESMHAPSKTSILYSAPFDPTNRLLPFCLALRRLFKEQDFLIDDNRELKLHATIVNTIYAKSKTRKLPTRARESSSRQGGYIEGHGPNATSPGKIDAIAILENFKDFCFAENLLLDRVAICEMGTKKSLDTSGKVVTEEYTEVAHIKLPS